MKTNITSQQILTIATLVAMLLGLLNYYVEAKVKPLIEDTKTLHKDIENIEIRLKGLSLYVYRIEQLENARKDN